MPKVKVLLRLDKPLSNSTFPIWIRITHLRKSSYISLGESCLAEEWDPETSRLWEVKPRITEKHKEELNPNELRNLKSQFSTVKINPLAKVINAKIGKEVRKVLSTRDKLEANEKSLSAKIIKKQLAQRDSASSDQSFLKYWDKQNTYIEQTGSFSTYKTYKSSLKVLRDFLKGKDLAFEEIDIHLLQKYEVYLKNEGLAIDSIHKYIRNFRAILYRAINEDLLEQGKNPFFKYKLKLDKNKRKERLSIDEIKKLQALELPLDSALWHTRNIFLFSFYNAGIRIGDLLQVKWENITNDNRLVYKMGKNGKDASQKINKQAEGILSLYKSKNVENKGYIFPFLNKELKEANKAFFRGQIDSQAASINSHLKDLAKLASIDKPISTHLARHSYADIARKKGVNIVDIQGLLKHSNISTTRVYLESLDNDSQDKAHETVFKDF